LKSQYEFSIAGKTTLITLVSSQLLHLLFSGREGAVCVLPR